MYFLSCGSQNAKQGLGQCCVAAWQVLVMQLGYRPMIERAFLKVKAKWQGDGLASKKGT